MDTILFALLLGTAFQLWRTGDRGRTLIWWTISFIGAAAFFKYHVTDPLNLNF